MKQMFLLIILILSSTLIIGQNCGKFHKNPDCRVKNSNGFKPFGQSRSTVVDAGKTYKYQVILFGGYDYKIGLCTEKDYTPIHIKILNVEDSTVIYDNSEDEYTETVGLANENTKNVLLEITVMASEMEFRDVGDSRTCLGINMMWRKIPLMVLKKKDDE